MKRERIGRNVCELYESLDEMPILNFHKFNKWSVIESQIGGDLVSVVSHLAKIKRNLANAPDKAGVQLDNLSSTFSMIFEETSPKSVAFVCLMKSFNGKSVNIKDDNELIRISKELQKHPFGLFDKLFEILKKKVDTELELYFPEKFSDATTKDAYDKIKKQTLLKLDSVIDGKSRQTEIDKITDYLYSLFVPVSFSGKNSFEITHEKNYLDACLLISEYANIQNVDNLTVVAFHNALEYVKNKLKNGTKPAKV